MIYRLVIHFNDREVSNTTADTRADLADLIDTAHKYFPRANGYEYTVSAEQTIRYTLVDSQLSTDGSSTAEKLWSVFDLQNVATRSR